MELLYNSKILFGVMLGKKLLRLADNLRYTLQQKDLSAAEGSQAAHLTCETSALRSDSEFVKFWDKVNAKQREVDVEESSLSQRRKVPKRYEVGVGEPHFPSTVEEYYRAIDLISCRTDLTSQVIRFIPTWKLYF